MKPLLACALALGLIGTAGAADTTRYVALVNGGKDKAGHLVATRSGDRYRVDFLFKDNGRGPELKEEYTLVGDGTFARYQVKGVSTFGSVVDENFSRSGDRARWKSTSDRGEQPVDGTALYSPLGGTPQGLSVALAALAQRPDGKLPLIPSGTLTARKIAGSVDFIFGAGQAVFDECEIVSRDRGSRTNNGYVTAPSTRRAPSGSTQ